VLTEWRQTGREQEEVARLLTALWKLSTYPRPTTAEVSSESLSLSPPALLDPIPSSDSESPEGEPPSEIGWKVRFHALSCIQAIARSRPRTLVAHAMLFLPDASPAVLARTTLGALP